MDALPVADDSDSESHHTISPSSSTASLPDMAFDNAKVPATIGIPPSSIPSASASATPAPATATAVTNNSSTYASASTSKLPHAFQSGRPVGLGLSSVNLEGASRRWPVALDLADEALTSDDEEEDDIEVDQHEMDSYMASHRVPVDAALRSMPGVVGLGDGWANVPQSKPKKRWFRKEKQVSAPPEDDPLALWSASDASAAPTSPEKESGNAKWWKSKKNLFNASQRVVSLPPPNPTNGPTSPSDVAGPSASANASVNGNAMKSPPVASKTRGGRLLGRSRLNFGSMVDLARAKDKDVRSSFTPDTPTSAKTCPFKEAAAKTTKAKRHSVPGVVSHGRLDKKDIGPPRPAHPLELSHGPSPAPAARSQPVIISAASSQPSFSPTPVPSHPMLRQSFARSESHLAGNAGIPPRPAPLIINSGAFAPTTSSMPLWRPPIMSPTPLLGVQEEDEEEHEQSVPESTERPPLKRSATFGDDEDITGDKKDKQQVSTAPLLPTVTASPREPSCAISIHSSNNGGNSVRGNASTKSDTPATPVVANSVANSSGTSNGTGNNNGKVGLIGRMKNAFNKGRRSRSHAPDSPQSFRSEREAPSAPAAVEEPTSSSTGRGLRPRSSIFLRRNQNAAASSIDFSVKRDDDKDESNKDSFRVSRHVVESMINLSTPSRNSELSPPTPTTPTPGRFDDLNGQSSSAASSNSRYKRNSWVGSFPRRHGDDDEVDLRDNSFESRRSRVSLRRLSKSGSKSRPGLGTVFPRPPTEVQQPPPLHWAIPSSSYSTPMLHKFGGSTLSLALDISADMDNGLGDIAERPRRDSSVSPTPSEARERHLASTIAALTSNKPRVTSTLAQKEAPRLLQRRASKRAAEAEERGERGVAPVTVPMNINYAASTDSLSLQPNIVDFPLPPSNSSGDISSSPDPDQVEQLYTPHDPSHYPQVPAEYYTAADVDCASDSSASSGPGSGARRLRKHSWTTAKSGGSRFTPIATPTSSTELAELPSKHTYTDSFDDQSFHSFPPSDERMSAFSSPRSTSIVI